VDSKFEPHLGTSGVQFGGEELLKKKKIAKTKKG